MYRIAKILELPESDFVINDKALFVNSTLTRISQDEIGKEYRTGAYLSAAINVINDAYNRLSTFENMIKTSYLTADLTATYITADTLIHDKDVMNVVTAGSKGAFLTNADAEAIKTECLLLISQMKEKAMNMFTANLDDVFKKQQSIEGVPIGSASTESTGAVLGPYVGSVIERYSKAEVNAADFDFMTGQFSLSSLMSNFETLRADVDFLEEYPIDTINDSFASIEEIKAEINALSDDSEYGFCNNLNYDGKINIPTRSVDSNNKTIPVTTIVSEILKRQIYIVIKNVYIQYLIKFAAYPKHET